MNDFSKDNYLKELLDNASGNIFDTIIHDLRNRANTLVMTSSYVREVLSTDSEASDEAKFLNSIDSLAHDISNIVEAYIEYMEMKRK
jgi:hypothetical protein